MVEADGEWHTSDNKYASVVWKTSHPPATHPPPPQKPKTPPQSPTKPANGKPKTGSQIVVLDSDDEDEGRVKRELSPSFASASSHSIGNSSVPQSQGSSADVIDLTLDSDEDEPVVSTQTGKRKVSDADLQSSSTLEQPWKKGRIEADLVLPAVRIPSSGTSNLNGIDYARAAPQITLPPMRPHPPAYNAAFTPPLPPSYTENFGRRPSTQVPPPQPYHNSSHRLNGTSRW